MLYALARPGKINTASVSSIPSLVTTTNEVIVIENPGMKYVVMT